MLCMRITKNHSVHNQIPLHFQHSSNVLFPTSFSRALAHSLWLFYKCHCDLYWQNPLEGSLGNTVEVGLMTSMMSLQKRNKRLILLGALFSSSDYDLTNNNFSRNLKTLLVMWKL
ncbi:hypothetical protein BT93_L0795 [Corymbia citriodora subsp. variegata]|uniref:Uncharacterized protein n=1 Tax=Corymbia citriodora subsp. variegata TaxID=360336 RepID=A0A8T0CP49_CORYI|nr:hypothetical protein BT93_L0795 [Corymbia citriodora subsp. variegata]